MVASAGDGMGAIPVYLGDRKLLVRTRWGGHLVVPSYNIDVAVGAARDGIIEPWTTRLIEELTRDGDTVVNVGANFGYYTVLSGLRVGDSGRVIAIEANPYIVPYLVASCFWSGVPHRVEIFHCAGWNVSGETLDFLFSPAFLGGGSARKLWVSRRDWADSGKVLVRSLDEALWDHRFVDVNADENRRVRLDVDRVVSFAVQTRTIDDICAGVENVKLIHMDIEGSEALALLGARRLVERSPELRIVFEWSSQRFSLGSAEARAAFEEVWGWLRGLGFRVRRLEPRLAPDGAIFVSDPVAFEHLAYETDGGDFVAVRPHNDPWGGN